MESITYQTNLRPASPQIKGGKEYRDERQLWICIDEILRTSRLESDFIARHLKGMDHREFCIRLADSHLLQWFLQIGHVEGVKAFAKSTSDRFA